jgi:hypothetical protein
MFGQNGEGWLCCVICMQINTVMLVLDTSIYVFCKETWVAGSSPAMTGVI